jgi:acyl-CoA synthetase (NDP forming)/GNAT superfamily N-acetyltransferase
MTIGRAKRPLTDQLLTPRSVCVLGATTLDGARILANLHTGGFGGDIWSVPGTSETVAGLPGVPDLTIIATAGEAAAADLAALGAHGGAVAILTGQLADLSGVAKAAGVRVLGPNAFGLAAPKLGLNASLSHMAIPRGHVALITQSASLARAVVDWAGPNGVGFSHVVGIGGNADVGFGAILDFLARDPDTRLILLDIRRVRARRAFISAARAASRLRPMVALRPGGLLLDPSGRSDGVFAAALNRAGVFVVDQFEDFLAAAETLSRARALRGEAMAVITNAIGPGRLAADAALRAGIRLAILPPEAQATLTASLPADLTQGLVYAGSAAPTDVANIAELVGAVPQVGGVLVLLAPTGANDGKAVDSVIAAARMAHLPVLTCVMGETTGAAHRRRIAEAGLPAFATPEQAVQAFSHLLRDRAARHAARELPPSRVLDIDPDLTAARRIVAGVLASDRLSLGRAESLALLACYGLAHAPPATGQAACLRCHDDPTFGPAIMLAASPAAACAYDLPPLNLPLAQAMAGRAGITGAPAAAAADALVRISQMLVDLPEIASLGIDRLVLSEDGEAGLEDAAVWLRPGGDRAWLAISPYPDHLSEAWSSHGQHFTIRPIRPEDAAAHAAMVSRIPPEDLRYRFFTAVRQVAPEQMVRLTQIDYDREMAFIAVRDSDQATVGVARLVCESSGGPGEFAILVEPDCKGLGLARHLMDRLAGWARARGIPAITGQVLADNHPMLGFMHRLGFTARRAPDEPDVVDVTLDLAPDHTPAGTSQ